MCADAAAQDLAARLASAREPNQGAACTTAAVLTGLRALGAGGRPPLDRAAVERGARGGHPLRLSTYSVGGHSVVVASVEPDGSWVVVDSNHPGVQRWARQGVAITATRLRPAISSY